MNLYDTTTTTITIIPRLVFQLAEHFINQNNSIDIYQPYFTDPNCQKMQTTAPSFRTVAVMSDPSEPTRPVQHISWSPDQGTLIAVSYANMEFQSADPESSPDSFVFDLGTTAVVSARFPRLHDVSAKYIFRARLF